MNRHRLKNFRVTFHSAGVAPATTHGYRTNSPQALVKFLLRRHTGAIIFQPEPRVLVVYLR